MEANNTEYYHLKKLKTEFSVRKRRNSNYSLRSFSNLMGLHSSIVSAILCSKRSVPLKHIDMIAKNLKFTELEKKYFLYSVNQQKKDKKNKKENKEIESNSFKSTDSSRYQEILTEEKHYSVIAEWEYYAFLNLIETIDFNNDRRWIARRLSVNIERVEKVINDLLELELIDQDDEGCFYRTARELNTTQDVFSKALRKSHKEILEIAKNKIDEIPIERRFFSNSTISVDVKNINMAKELIRDFRDKLSKVLENGERAEVYNLSLNLFPLTNINTENENKMEL